MILYREVHDSTSNGPVKAFCSAQIELSDYPSLVLSEVGSNIHFTELPTTTFVGPRGALPLRPRPQV